MPRPNRNEKNRLEQRRVAKQKLRDDNAALEKRVADRVQGLVDDALARSKAREELPDLRELMHRLEEARQVALTTFPPQANAAVNATMAQAKLMGFIVDRKAIAIGSPGEFRAKSEQEVLEDLRERIGSAGAEQFRMAVEIMRQAYEGDGDGDGRLIEGNVEDDDEEGN